MEIQQFRRIYPEYNNISDEKLSRLLHQKFYSDIPLREFQIKFGVREPKIIPPIEIKKSEILTETAEGLSIQFGKELIGAAETAEYLGGSVLQFFAQAIPGWAGIGEGLRTGDPEAATKVINEINKEWTDFSRMYQPITESGKRGVAGVNRIFQFFGDLGRWINTKSGTRKIPEVATVIDGFFEVVLPIFLISRAMKSKGTQPVSPEDIIRLEKEIQKAGEQWRYPKTRVNDILRELRKEEGYNKLVRDPIMEEMARKVIEREKPGLIAEESAEFLAQRELGLPRAKPYYTIPEELPKPIKGRIIKPKKKPFIPKTQEMLEKQINEFSDIGADEVGRVLISPEEFRKGLRKAYALIHTEAPWQSMGVPETGFNVKNYFSQREFWQNKAREQVGYTLRKLTKEERSEAVLLWEKDRSFVKGTKFEKPYDAWHKYSKEVLNEYIRLKILHQGWPDSFVDSANAKISDYLGRKKGAKKYATEIAELENLIDRAKDMKFVHIPTRLWFEEKAMTDPAWGIRTLNYLARRKRKTISIQDLIDENFIKLEDIDAVDVIQSYGRRAGRDIAIGKIIESAKQDGILTTKPSPELVELPSYRFPILKGYYSHPIIADWFYQYLLNTGRQSTLRNAFVATKMWQFHQPAYLGMIDTIQGAMLTLLDRKTFNMPKYMRQAMNDFVKKTPEYWEAQNYGIRSKPFNPPYDEWVAAMKDLKMENRGLWNIIRKNAGPQAIKNLYRLSWNTAWNYIDPFIRQVSYRFLIDKGFSPKDAAQMSAMYHSDYAGVPWRTKNLLNIPLFTPTYKIAMGKLMFIEWTKAVGKAILGKKLDPKATMAVRAINRMFMKGALNAALILWGVHLYWTKIHGFKSDQPGRRYYKEVEVLNPETGEMEKKELVVPWSAPPNIPLKFAYRTVEALKPGEKTFLKKMIETNKWEFHPIFRVGMEITENKADAGGPIYETNDPDHIKVLKASYYLTTRLVRMTGILDAAQKDRSAQEALAKEIGRLQQILWYPFSFSYLRDPKDIRTIWKAKRLQKQLENQLRRVGEIPEQNLIEHNKQMKEILDELED